MNNKNILYTGLAVVFVLITAIIWWIVSPSWTPLYPNALPNSAQQVVLQQLSINGFDYKVDPKNIILVKSDSFKSIQNLLSEKGLPEKVSNGLEIFSSSDYGLSDFAQNINYQRGMEEELSRTIKKIKGIKDVRVHLTIKKDSLFEERKQKPKASVVISPFHNNVLSNQNIKSIQEIVAAAVVNLEPSNVVVITDAGFVLSRDNDDLDSFDGDASLEERYSSQIKELLSLVLPNESFKISVNVLVEKRKKITIEENYFPDLGSGKGFLLKKKTSENGIYDKGITDRSSSKTNEEEYVFSKERSEIVYPEKAIKKISVGLVVSDDISPENMKSIESLIFNSIGMDQERGDSVTSYYSVLPKGIKDTSVIDSKEELDSFSEAKKSSYISYVESNMEYIFFLMILFFMTSIFFMVLYFFSRRSNSSSLSSADLDVLVNNIKSWVDQR